MKASGSGVGMPVARMHARGHRGRRLPREQPRRPSAIDVGRYGQGRRHCRRVYSTRQGTRDDDFFSLSRHWNASRIDAVIVPFAKPEHQRGSLGTARFSPASQAASEAPYDGMVYPESGDAPCGTPGYTGSIKKISAIDRLTVEFPMCAPDPAFLPKVAFSVVRHPGRGLSRDARRRTSPSSSSQRHRPLQAQGLGARATGSSSRPTPTTGATRPRPRTSSSAGATRPPRGCSSSSPATSTASTTPAPTTSPRSRATAPCAFFPREGMNVFYLGLNNTDQAVGQRGRPQGASPSASTASGSSTTSIRKARRSRRTSRRAPCRSAAKATTGTTSTPPRPSSS